MDSNTPKPTRTANYAAVSAVLPAASASRTRGEKGPAHPQPSERVPKEPRHGLRVDDCPKELQVRGRSSEAIVSTLTGRPRNAQDDGILTGLLGGPLVAAAELYVSLTMSASTPPGDPVPPGWRIEPPMTLADSPKPTTPLEALLLSRRYLVSQATFCATILLVHVIASWITEARHRRKRVIPEGEVSSVPRKEGRRTYLYVLFAFSVTLWILCVRIALKELKLGIWQSAYQNSVAGLRVSRMNRSRHVIPRGRGKFYILPVFTLRLRSTSPPWIHVRRIGSCGLWCHCLVYGAHEHDFCEGGYR